RHHWLARSAAPQSDARRAAWLKTADAAARSRSRAAALARSLMLPTRMASGVHGGRGRGTSGNRRESVFVSISLPGDGDGMAGTLEDELAGGRVAAGRVVREPVADGTVAVGGVPCADLAGDAGGEFCSGGAVA